MRGWELAKRVVKGNPTTLRKTLKFYWLCLVLGLCVSLYFLSTEIIQITFEVPDMRGHIPWVSSEVLICICWNSRAKLIKYVKGTRKIFCLCDVFLRGREMNLTLIFFVVFKWQEWNFFKVKQYRSIYNRNPKFHTPTTKVS
jgi:hypothetical protein